jgi:hypothetical protein
LNLGIGFLSPAADPSSDGTVLPTSEADEFKPFVRKLPEFKFWHATTRAIVVAFCMTFFSIFNIPVFWPILVCYFIALFIMTMRRQIQCAPAPVLRPPCWRPGARRSARAAQRARLSERGRGVCSCRHMIKHKYVPFSLGKKVFKGKKDSPAE